jgi:hypothetical protein
VFKRDARLVSAEPVVLVDGASPDDLRQLYSWLLAEDDLRGRVKLVERGPEAGVLGPVLDAIRILADPSGAVLASGLVAWVKHRRSSVKVTVTGPAGESLSVEANRVHLMNAAEVGEFTQQVAAVVRSGSGQKADGGRAVPGAPTDSSVSAG